MAHIYENGTRAWQPDVTDGWVASEVVEKKIEGDKVKLVFQLENGEVRTHMHARTHSDKTPPREEVAGRHLGRDAG
jgi:myosin heavy subunit